MKFDIEYLRVIRATVDTSSIESAAAIAQHCVKQYPDGDVRILSIRAHGTAELEAKKMALVKLELADDCTPLLTLRANPAGFPLDPRDPPSAV